MYHLLRQFTEIVPSGYTFDLKDVLIVLTLSFILSLLIGKIYSTTHNGISYSKAFVQTLILLCMVVSCIMLIVGSNIARAFTLLGALSIVRFRNAVKETRDVGFVFFVMAVGMACGTRFYALAILMSVLICLAIITLEGTNYGGKSTRQSLLKLVLPNEENYQEELFKLLEKHLKSFSLINIEAISDGLNEYSFVIIYKKRTEDTILLSELRSLNKGNYASIMHGDSVVDI